MDLNHLSRIVKDVCVRNGTPVPRLFLAHYKGEWLVTISDVETIFSFMSFEGAIFMGVGRKCIPYPPDKPEYYLVEEDMALNIVSCSKSKNDYSKMEGDLLMGIQRLFETTQKKKGRR